MQMRSRDYEKTVDAMFMPVRVAVVAPSRRRGAVPPNYRWLYGEGLWRLVCFSTAPAISGEQGKDAEGLCLRLSRKTPPVS